MKAVALVSMLLAEAVAGAAGRDLSPAQLNARAIDAFSQRRYAEAENLYRQSLEGWDRLGPQGAASRAITAGNLGALLKTVGRYAEAEPQLQGWLRQAEASEGADSLNAGRANSSLAALYQVWGQAAKGEPFAVHANAVFAATLDSDSPERLENSRVLASLWMEEGRYAEGEALLNALLPALPERMAVAAYNDLAVMEIRQEHLAEAEKLARQAFELAGRSLPAKHPLAAVTLNNLAQAERFEKHYLDAETHYREAIDIWRETLGPGHPDTAKGMMNLAGFYHDRGRESGAEDLYRRAAAIFETAFGKEHPLALIARNELGEVLRAEHRYSESERLSKATLMPLGSALGERDARVMRAMANRVRLLQETRRTSEAASLRARIDGMGQGFTDPKL